jgi:hypothetical protein
LQTFLAGAERECRLNLRLPLSVTAVTVENRKLSITAITLGCNAKAVAYNLDIIYFHSAETSCCDFFFAFSRLFFLLGVHLTTSTKKFQFIRCQLT